MRCNRCDTPRPQQLHPRDEFLRFVREKFGLTSGNAHAHAFHGVALEYENDTPRPNPPKQFLADAHTLVLQAGERARMLSGTDLGGATVYRSSSGFTVLRPLNEGAVRAALLPIHDLLERAWAMDRQTTLKLLEDPTNAYTHAHTRTHTRTHTRAHTHTHTHKYLFRI